MSRSHPSHLSLRSGAVLNLFGVLSFMAGSLWFRFSTHALEIELRPEGPISTLIAARDAVREARKAGDSSPVVVRVTEGRYRFEEALVLEPQDSGIRFEAAPGARPLFLGAKSVRGLELDAKGVWVGKIEAKQMFEALWVNGKRGVRAQTPNEGFVNAVGQPKDPVDGIPLPGPATKTLIGVAPEDAEALGALSPSDQKRVQVSVYHSWDVSRLNLAGLVASEGKLQFTGGVRDFFYLEPWHRLKFENYLGALDVPGEWFLEENGTLRYIPRTAENPDSAEIEFAVAPQWIVFKGVPEKGQWVRDVVFSGLRFGFQSWTTPPQGMHAGQAESNLPLPAIEANGVQKVTFENCEFAHTMTHAMWLRAGCSAVSLKNCYFHDLGAGGVYVGDPGVKEEGPKHTHHVSVENCIFRGGGRHFLAGIGVVLFHASDSTISHCDIGDFFYSAISMGWTWGYKPTVAGRNRVEFCHLHHLGWGVLSDMGAVYTLGSQIGTVIRNNHIHDIGCASYGGWGLYNDEGSTGVLWENNLVHDTQTAGYHQHYGRGNLVRNNIFAWGKEEQLRRSKPEDTLAFAFEKNIVLMGDGKLLTQLDKNWHDGRVFMADNVYWSKTGAPQDFAGKTWSEWQAFGNDVRSVLADPMFHDPEHGDWTLSPESPALKLGFIPFDWKLAGVQGDAAWKAIASEPLPPMVYGKKPQPPPLRVQESFEGFKNGERISLGRRNAHNPALYAVAGISGAKGQCLELRDGPDQQPAFEPHFFFNPSHREGLTRVSFDLRMEPAYRFIHEWRDASEPYRTGIQFSVDKGGVHANGRTLAEFAPMTWVHFEVECAVGENVNGDWTLVLTPENGQPKRFEGLKSVKGALKKLEWLGFISPGMDSAKAWLDNLEIVNQP